MPEISDAEGRFSFHVPEVTPAGQPVRIMREAHDGVHRVHALSPDESELYFEVTAYPRRVVHDDAVAEQQRFLIANSRDGQVTAADRTTLASHTATSFGFQGTLGSRWKVRRFLFVDVSERTFRIVYDPTSSANTELLRSLTLSTDTALGKANDKITETPRLTLRRFNSGDAAFILTLVNDPDWIRFIGDRNVHSLDDARAYIQNRLIAAYARHGFGFWWVGLKADDTPIGMCGLIQRDGLDDVDVGFAFLPPYRGQGYALEAAEATLAYARDVLGLKRIVAITSVDNDRSGRLVEKLGLRFERLVRLPDDTEDVRLFGLNAAA